MTEAGSSGRKAPRLSCCSRLRAYHQHINVLPPPDCRLFPRSEVHVQASRALADRGEEGSGCALSRGGCRRVATVRNSAASARDAMHGSCAKPASSLPGRRPCLDCAAPILHAAPAPAGHEDACPKRMVSRVRRHRAVQRLPLQRDGTPQQPAAGAGM